MAHNNTEHVELIRLLLAMTGEGKMHEQERIKHFFAMLNFFVAALI